MPVDKSDKKYLIIGMVGTALWVFVIGITLLGAADISWANLKAMKANEWGDFLAGFFAPLAFFWFVIAFLQQGAELRASVSQFANQAKSLEETNILEAQKLAMAKWDRTHLEMSNILTTYLYKYASQKNSKIKQEAKALKNKQEVNTISLVTDPAEFINDSWVKYSQGDKNTFFRTVFSHSKYSDTRCLKEFFTSSIYKTERYLELQRNLESLCGDGQLLGAYYMTEEMRGVAKYLRKLLRE